MFNIYDYIRLFVCIIAIYILATRKPKIWVLADLLVSVSLGVWLMIGKPSLAGLFTNKLDPLHVYLIQALGCYTLMMALYWFQCSKSRDYNVMRVVMMCRTMAAGMTVLLDVINFYRFPKAFTSLHLNTLCFGVLWLVGSTYQLINHGLPTLRNEYKVPLNQFLKADLAITACVGLCGVFLPGYALGVMSMKTNVLHVHFTQAFGICAAASAILSYMALGFRDSGDKKAVLLSRAVVNVLMLLCFTSCCTLRGLAVSSRDVLLCCVTTTVLLAPTIGVYIHRDRHLLVSGDGYYLRSRED